METELHTKRISLGRVSMEIHFIVASIGAQRLIIAPGRDTKQ
jgi:hypothetical protein